MPASLKVLESKLASAGYDHSWKLIKEDELTLDKDNLCEDDRSDFVKALLSNLRRPLCQHIDIIAADKERSLQETQQYQRFLTILGSPCHREGYGEHDVADNSSLALSAHSHSFVHDDIKRMDRIREFISTEESYVNTLHAMMQAIVLPLRKSASNKHPILNHFKCSKIFLNIDQILEANSHFFNDLQAAENEAQCFGDICAQHITNFDCYRKYLLERDEAQKLHVKEFKSNQAYRSFLIRAKDHPQFKKRQLSDLQIEPPQRIVRYAMMLKGILRYTPDDHPDFAGLTSAYAKSSEIADMDEDDPIKLATMFMKLHSSIKGSPCTLVKQSRSLVTQLDATEIHRVTNKSTRDVTLLVLTDKLMVVEKPTGLSKSIRKDHGPKFRGWVDIENVEIFDGSQERTASFLLRTTSAHQQESDPNNTTTESFEKYFKKGPRLYSVAPAKENEATIEDASVYKRQRDDFIASFQKTQALSKQQADHDATYYQRWCDTNMYSNVYTPSAYMQMKQKSNIVVIFLGDDTEIDPALLFRPEEEFPWIVALVQADIRGFRLSLWSKTDLLANVDDTPSKIEQDHKQPIDFECVFWNNLIICDRTLRKSYEFWDCYQSPTEKELVRRRRSRSRSLSRSTSIPSIGKIFSSRSRSTSPSRASSGGVNPTSSRSTPTQVDCRSPRKRLSSIGSYRTSRSNSLTSDSSSLASPTSPESYSAANNSLLNSSAGINSMKGVARKSSTESLLRYNNRHHLESRPHRISTSLLPSLLQVNPHELSPLKSRKDLAISPRELRAPPPDGYLDKDEMKQKKRYTTGDIHNLSKAADTRDYEKAQLNARIQAVYSVMSKEQDTRGVVTPTSSPSSFGFSSDSPSRPSSRSSMTSSAASMMLNQLGSNGHSSSSRSSGSNTASSATSQSTRSSISLEELEIHRLMSGHSPQAMMVSSGRDDTDDDIVHKIQEIQASQKKKRHNSTRKWSPVLESPDSILDKTRTETPNYFYAHQRALDHVAEALETLGNNSRERWRIVAEQHRKLQHQIASIAECFQSGDIEAGALVETYKKAQEETYEFYHRYNSELRDITDLVRGYQQIEDTTALNT